ncbi:PilW family protein [Paraneptunicella aestuarii]|uniref:PilW family protein n=1 Tax=Paraneptunicella aestuarii TaxID=2831148 RepID=UPI001E65966E|nr:PilW family protein [Paraneptunicella aestuarii]UAA39995.1 PilW family protein [Paraneptunicella aestuarii]
MRRFGRTLPSMHQQGFTIVELMISLTMGLLISAAVVQMMASNQVTDRLNRALASSQESGRFIINRLRSDLLMTGRYDPMDPNLNTLVDIADESAFVQNHPVVIPNDFVNNLGLGSVQAINGGNDTLVVGMQGVRDCRGYKLGYLDNEEFYVVNEYFVEDNKLKCRGFDGRVLRGQKVAAGNNGDAAFTLLDNVLNFQVLYGISANAGTNDNTGRPINYVTADQLSAERVLGSHVVAIRIALVVEGDGEAFIDPVPSFKLLNEPVYTPPGHSLYKMYETTVTLRNMKNFVRARKT